MSNNCNTCNTPTTYGSYNNHKVATSQYSSDGIGCYTKQPAKPKCNWHRRDHNKYIFAQSCSPNLTATCGNTSSSGTKVIKRERTYLEDHLVNNFLWGERVLNSDLDIRAFSGIPQYLIQSCPPQTTGNSNGRKVGPQYCNEEGTWQAYIKVVGQKAYLYTRNCDTNQTIDIADWDWGIADCAISSVHADKILDWCSLFAKATIPIEEYKDYNGCFNDEMFITTPVTLTDDCKLKGIIQKSDIRKAVIPYLNNCKDTPIWEYNPISDEKPQFIKGSLNGCVAVRVDKETVIGQNNPDADYAGDDSNPLKSKTFVEGYGDPEEEEGYLKGDGTPENPLDIKENSIDDSRIAICTGGFTSKAINHDDKYFSVFAEKSNPSLRIKNMTFKSSRLVYEDNQAGFNKRAIWEIDYEADVPDTGCDGKVWIGQLSAWSRHPVSTIRDSQNRDVAIEYTLGVVSDKGVYLNNINDTSLKTVTRQGVHKSSNDYSRNYASSTGYHLSCSTSLGLHPGKAVIRIFTIAVFPNDYNNPATELFDTITGIMSTPDKWFSDCNINLKLDGLITK